MAPRIKPLRTLSLVAAILWLTACSGSDDSTPSTTNQPPTNSQEPTKPPLTTQPPNIAPPSSQPPGSQPPPGSTPPGPGSGGTFVQGTGFNSYVRTIVMPQDGTNDLYVGGDFTIYNGTTANHLIRLRPNGTVA